jgi:hypothetical protein
MRPEGYQVQYLTEVQAQNDRQGRDTECEYVVVPRAPSPLTVILSPDVLYRGEGSAFGLLMNAHADSSP